jgi:hypothetical protein
MGVVELFSTIAFPRAVAEVASARRVETRWSMVLKRVCVERWNRAASKSMEDLCFDDRQDDVCNSSYTLLSHACDVTTRPYTSDVPLPTFYKTHSNPQQETYYRVAMLPCNKPPQSSTTSRRSSRQSPLSGEIQYSDKLAG